MREYSHVLCLFCKTGKEQSVAHRISENGVGTAIFPQRISKRYSKERRGYEEIKAPLLPGYVFLALEYSAENYYRVKAIPHVLRFLGPNGLSPSYLTHLEVEWLRLLDNGGELLKPSRVEELPGGGVRIVEGVLRHFPVSRIDLDKRARRAKVEISLCGEPKTLTLSVEGDGSEEAGSS